VFHSSSIDDEDGEGGFATPPHCGHFVQQKREGVSLEVKIKVNSHKGLAQVYG
jgi:hypothetical protein